MDDEDDIDLFISFGLDVKLMRFFGNLLIPSNITINIAVTRDVEADDNSIEFALSKWRYWIEQIVSKTIVFSINNTSAQEILLTADGANRTGNLFVLTPDEPTDELLGGLFQAKFNALGNGVLVANSVEITSDNLHGLSFTLLGNHAAYLPTSSSEFIGGETFWDKPWWHRNDASTIDVLKPDEETKTPAWAYSLDFLDRQQTNQGIVIQPKSGFNPTVIVGGKPDKTK